MSWATSLGWETIATWLDGISTVVAPMRLANWRSASGGIASSFSATRNQDGCDFQAGTPITSSSVDAARGCCTAYMTRACTVSTSAAKWLTKSSSGSQAKPCLSMSRCARAGVGGTLRQQSADRFAFVKTEGRNVDQASDVRCVRAQGSDDLAAVGVASDNGRAVLAVQHLTQPGDVIGQGGLRELRCRNVIAGGLQPLDDGAPARPVGPRAVHKDDIRLSVHVGDSFPLMPSSRQPSR